MNSFLIASQKMSQESIHFRDVYICQEQDYSLDHWKSFCDKDRGVHICIHGRPTVDIEEWENCKKDDESYISRLLIDRYKQENLGNFCTSLNGTFTIIILDSIRGAMIVITDKLGIFPVYAYQCENLHDFCLSSNINYILNHLPQNLNIDQVSAAEFLKKGFIYHPNTFYQEIKTLTNGSYYIYDFEKSVVTANQYFRMQENFVYDFDFLVDTLANAMSHAIERRTHAHYGKKAVFLSGGSDSRTILNNTIDDADAVTLYDIKNYEIQTTQKICNFLNKPQSLIKRGEAYYLEAFDKSIKLNGGRSLPTDDHFINIAHDERIKKYDTILTGCYADWMFKGIALNRKQASLFNKISLPLFKIVTFSFDFFSQRTILGKYYEKLIQQREDKIFLDKNNHFATENKRLFPLFQEETASTRLTLQQLFSWDTIFSDNEIIEVYQMIPVQYKINSQLYDQAVAKLNKNIAHIPHANKRHRIGINIYLSTGLYLFSIITNKILRKLGIIKQNKIYGEGSWLSFQEYAKLNFIKDRYRSLLSSTANRKILEAFLPEIGCYNELQRYDYKLIYKVIVLFEVLNKGQK